MSKLKCIDYMDGGCCRGRIGDDDDRPVISYDDEQDIIDDDNKQRAADMNAVLLDIGGG